MKKIREYGYIIAIVICFIVLSICIISVVNAEKGTTISDLLKDENITQQEKIPISIDDLINGLGTSIDYAVFANTFNLESHMEGNIAVKDAYIDQIFNFTKAVIQIDKSNSYSITVNNTVNGSFEDETFRFALFTKETNTETGEEHFVRANYDIITVTTQEGKGTAHFDNLSSDTKYYIFELDEKDNPIMNNTTTADGTTVIYGDYEESVSGSKLNSANTSYIQNIKKWTNNAANANDGENPKLVIPIKEYLNLIVDNNGNLSHNNYGVVLNAEPSDFELIVIGEDGENYKVVRDNDNNTYGLQERDNEYNTINFEDNFQRLNNFSSILYNTASSSEEVNVINLDADGAIYINGQVNGLNNGNADSDTLDLSEYLENDKYLVINVDMSGLNNINLSNIIDWGDLGGTYSWNTVSTRILWNFYNRESNTPYIGDIYIQKNTIMGTILAPSANVIVGSTINANIIADRASNPGGEIHKAQFSSGRKMVKTTCFNSKQTIEKGEFSISLNKVDNMTLKPLPNAIFNITVKDEDKIIREEKAETNNLGEITIDGVEIPDKEKKYNIIIEEILAPDGYSQSRSISFEVTTVVKENKYVLQPVETYEEDGCKITIQNNKVNVTIPNSRIKGNFNIRLIKRNSENNNLINGIIFDIKVLDEENNEIKLLNDITEQEINLENLVTGEINRDGAINIENIRINSAQKYIITITERKTTLYKNIDPIVINVETIIDNGEYKLGEINLVNNNREDVALVKENNTILLDVKNKKEITGKYTINLQKINSITKEGLNGVKFHISIFDSENNIIMDENILTHNIDGQDGYIDIENIYVNKPGIYRCEIREIEALNGYRKFEQKIIVELDIEMNDSEDGYEVKSIRNLEEYSENLKMEMRDNNNIAIVLANDPSKESEKEVEPEKKPKEDQKENYKVQKILPQTGDDILMFIAILVVSAVIVSIYFSYNGKE